MSGMTIRDIAQEAGVGKSTVSRVINEIGYVNEDTRKKIEEVMKKHGYVPSSAARSLSRKESDTIGLIIPEANNPFFAEILNGVSHVIDDNDLTMILCNSGNDIKKDIKSLQVMLKQRVKGLIFTPASDYGSKRVYEQLTELLGKLNCPTVLLDRHVENLQTDGVFFDNFRGAYLGTEALIKAGHRKIGTIVGDTSLSIGSARLAGFEKALEVYGIKKKRHYMVPGQFDAEITYAKMNELLDSNDWPTALFVSNNLSCSGFLRAMRDRDLKIPDDIAFVSFDKMEGQDIFGLNYSYIERNVENMGKAAINLLLKRFEDPKRPLETIVMEPQVVLLGSERLTPR
jgi:LacI family transcriptional regulator